MENQSHTTFDPRPTIRRITNSTIIVCVIALSLPVDLATQVRILWVIFIAQTLVVLWTVIAPLWKDLVVQIVDGEYFMFNLQWATALYIAMMAVNIGLIYFFIPDPQHTKDWLIVSIGAQVAIIEVLHSRLTHNSSRK